MFNGWEIVAIMGLALILFGAKKLPELARGLGQGLREFKKSTREITDELESAVDVDARPRAPQRTLPKEPPVSHQTDDSYAAEPPASDASPTTPSEQKA
jgi:sec-independent protein translocase protein TatA